MKQVKIEYLKCKKRMPHRPLDEIDFGLGWRTALKWVLDTCVLSGTEEMDIEEELE